jgi:hypothetical protein
MKTEKIFAVKEAFSLQAKRYCIGDKFMADTKPSAAIKEISYFKPILDQSFVTIYVNAYDKDNNVMFSWLANSVNIQYYTVE